ncbi:MAG: hypothetical protein AB1505_13155 [Candidatus Latescibacterota bacterium]
MTEAHCAAAQAALLRSLGWRGDRPLSLLDLVERDSLDLETSAWLVSRLSAGASFLVGAVPGSAGKTTTMRALLDFAPARIPFALALPGQVAQLDGVPRCVISHELSSHDVPGYLWGQDLRDYFALTGRGHLLAANLHADDLEATHAQICGQNGVPEAHFRAVGLLLFMRRRGREPHVQRFVSRVEWSDGQAPHRTVYTRQDGLTAAAPRDQEGEAHCRAFLEEGLASSWRSVEEVRRRFVAWGA